MCNLTGEMQFSIRAEWDEQEQVWVTYVPALGGISTFGDTIEEALRRTKEAVLGYLEAAEKEGIALPVGAVDANTVRLALAAG